METTGPTLGCRLILFICGWIAYAAGGVIAVMGWLKSDYFSTLGELAAWVFAAAVAGATLHAMAHLLDRLTAATELLKRIESDVRHMRDVGDGRGR